MILSPQGGAGVACACGMRVLGLFGCLSVVCLAVGGCATAGQPNSAHGFDVDSVSWSPYAVSSGTQRLERDWGKGRLTAEASLPFDLTLNGGLLNLPDPAAPGDHTLSATAAIPAQLFSDLSLSYERSTPGGHRWIVGAELPGTPALGPQDHVRRFSGLHGEEQPLGASWVNPGVPSHGLVTTGYQKGRFGLEASAFNRTDVGHQLSSVDSYATRLSYAPVAHWSLQYSHGWLALPGPGEETLERSIASALYRRGSDERRFESLLAWGRKDQTSSGASDAFLWDLSLDLREKHTLFGRIERLDSAAAGVIGLADPNTDASVVSFGYAFTRPLWERFSIGFGLMQHEQLASHAGDSQVAFFRFGLM